jgi:hypothetical protein
MSLRNESLRLYRRMLKNIANKLPEESRSHYRKCVGDVNCCVLGVLLGQRLTGAAEALLLCLLLCFSHVRSGFISHRDEDDDDRIRFISLPLFESAYLTMRWSDSVGMTISAHMALQSVLVMNILSSLVPRTRMITNHAPNAKNHRLVLQQAESDMAWIMEKVPPACVFVFAAVPHRLVCVRFAFARVDLNRVMRSRASCVVGVVDVVLCWFC